MDHNSRILITGGKGFLGTFLFKKLREKGYNNIITFTSKEYDITKEEEVKKLFENLGPFDIVLHLAARVGGIMFNKKNSGRIFYENIMMNTLVQEYSRRNNVKKFVGIGSVCSYPKFTEVPFLEEELWLGYPEESNASYGLGKKMMLVQSQAYREQYNFNSIHLLMINLYGPGDNFNSESSHVIPALIKKIKDAVDNNSDKVEVWGSGNASREFLYVEDAAEGIIKAMENYDGFSPVNLGSGKEITIRDLVEKICLLMRFEGEIIYDKSKPEGQIRRCLNTEKAKKLFNFNAETPIDIGLKRTIDFYLNSKK
jgi:GDP-L-fucose synthase